MKVKAQSAALACVILAAGKGTRMKSALPKVMHAVAGKPMLWHVIDAAQAMKAAKILLVTSPDMKSVRDAITRSYKSAVEHTVQKEQRGTGDAVKAAQAALKKNSGIVLVLYGDTPLMRPETLTSLTNALKADTSAAIALLGIEMDTPGSYGRLVLNKKGEVERIVEAQDATAKEKSITLCNSGVMAIRGDLLSSLLDRLTNRNAKKEYYLTDIVALARKDKYRTVVVQADAVELLGVNSRAELACAEANMQRRLRKQAMENGVTLLDPASVYFSWDTKLGQDVVVHPHVVFGTSVTVQHRTEIRSFCHIEGATVQSGAVIGPFARLRPGAIIGESVHVGNFVEIKQAKLEQGAKVNHLSYIGDAHIGENANIGAGTITCNFDGYHKHRTVVGSGTFIGSNSSLVAPVTIGDGAIIGAGSVISEDVEADALAVTRSPQKQKLQWAKSFRHRKSH